MILLKKYPKIEIEVYTCEKCNKNWYQRPLHNKDTNDIKKPILVRPKNCTHCKSPTWQEPRV